MVRLLVHNDVKPDNILFDSHGAVKLSDFGCAKQMEDALTPLTEPVGSLRFQSYEKKFLSPIRYTTKSDLYSLGVAVAEILNGSHIEEERRDDGPSASTLDAVGAVSAEDDPEQIPYKIPHSVRQRFGGGHADSDCAVIDFLEKCLEKNFNRRWSAEQLLRHRFVADIADGDGEGIKEAMFSGLRTERGDDLESMTEMLIEYYLNYNRSRRPSASKGGGGGGTVAQDLFADLSRTPMDDEFSDSQRVANIARYSGFSVERVQEYIYQSVNDVKNQYLRR